MAALKPYMPGMLKDTGTHFELTDSNYINITLDSTAPVKVMLRSIPKVIDFHIEVDENPGSPSTNSEITISNLEPLTTYHKYEDSFLNHTPFTTDESGKYTYIQDLSAPHFIIIQPKPSTIFLDDKGFTPSYIGTWNSVTRTATLTQNVTQTIEIRTSNITLDGSGQYSVSAETAYSIFANGRTNVTIKNVIISNCSYGISLHSCFSNTVCNCIFANMDIGIDFQPNSSNNNIVKNIFTDISNYGIFMSDFCIGNLIDLNTFQRNTFFGVCIDYNSKSNLLTNNTFNDNATAVYLGTFCSQNILYNNLIERNAYGIDDDSGEKNIIYNNNFNYNEYQISISASSDILNLDKDKGAGNHWSNYTSPDSNNDGIVDNPLVFNSSNIDSFPWVQMNGWVTTNTVINLSGDLKSSGWYASDVTVSLTASAKSGFSVAMTQYCFDGRNWIDYTQPFKISNDGLTTIIYRSINSQGWIEPEKSETLKIDRTAPAINISTPDATTLYLLNSRITANWSVTDPLSGVASANGTVPKGSPIDTSTIGIKSFFVHAVDNVGNEQTVTVNYQVVEQPTRGIDFLA